MTFIHHDPEFPDLLRIVAEARQIPVSLIEKDYWVTHTLWALQDLGMEVWFKGGTSLASRAFRQLHKSTRSGGYVSMIPWCAYLSFLAPAAHWN